MSSPPKIFDRDLLLRHRERAARSETIPDFLLERTAEDLSDRLAVTNRTFKDALNLSASTGQLERAFQLLSNVRSIASSESSKALAEFARSRVLADVLVVDEEMLAFEAESYDLITSALTLQYVNDLPGTLTQIRRALKPDGLFMGALVGGATLTELRQATLAAEEELTGGASPRVAPMADVRDLGALLQRAGFALPVADSDVITVTYQTAFDLMRELKAMGASNVLMERRRVPMTRSLVTRIAEIYQERFATEDGRIAATFEILTMTGWAPHESQQQPLRPGSARSRLADALGTTERATGDTAGVPKNGDRPDDE
ncbi:MAG: methyltransferase domain-containing protein [Pseudomonadota bacterium]